MLVIFLEKNIFIEKMERETGLEPVTLSLEG